MDATQIPLQHLQPAKTWLISNGISVLMALAIFILGRWLDGQLLWERRPFSRQE